MSGLEERKPALLLYGGTIHEVWEGDVDWLAELVAPVCLDTQPENRRDGFDICRKREWTGEKHPHFNVESTLRDGPWWENQFNSMCFRIVHLPFTAALEHTWSLNEWEVRGTVWHK